MADVKDILSSSPLTPKCSRLPSLIDRGRNRPIFRKIQVNVTKCNLSNNQDFRRHFRIPTGFRPKAQGWPVPNRAGQPWVCHTKIHQPRKRLCHWLRMARPRKPGRTDQNQLMKNQKLTSYLRRDVPTRHSSSVTYHSCPASPSLRFASHCKVMQAFDVKKTALITPLPPCFRHLRG